VSVTHSRRAASPKSALGASSGGLLLFGICYSARTFVYIDGFNLYYRVLKGTAYEWLDVAALSRAALPSICQIEAVNYYTAHISGRVDLDAPKRQHAYLRAIATLPNVAIHYGNFLVSQKWAGLVQPPEFRSKVALPAGPQPEVAYVWKTEEKGSGVSLGVHLVRNAFRGHFDTAAVITNDTDLVEPIRIETQELDLPVTLLTPSAQPAASLTKVATNVRHIRPYVGPCQLPNPVPVPGKRSKAKPVSW
jgi:hypothetical protein